MDNKEALLVEYQSCYNKLDTITNIQNTLYLFAITSIGTLLAFAIQQKNPYIPVVGYIILLLTKCRLTYYRDDYYINHAYIRKVIEPKLGVNSFIKGEIKINRISRFQYFTFTLLAIGIFLTYVIYYADNASFLAVSIVFLLLIVSLDCYYLLCSKQLYQKILDQYTKFLENN